MVAKKTAGTKKTAAKKTATDETAAAGATDATAAAQGTADKAAKKTAQAKKTGAKKVVAKKTAVTEAPASRVPGEPAEYAVRAGEEPWSPAEIEEARTELLTETVRLAAELDASEVALSGLTRDGDGVGDDADTGTQNITREHEMSLAANARENLVQTERALQRLETGTYGSCESCGKPIGKARMQAFPRATLCMECKQRQERR